jgi:DNA-binding SARP family transcriptional activator
VQDLPGDVASLAALTPPQAQLLDHELVTALVSKATDAELQAHPYALMHLARVSEPGHYLAQRAAALDQLAELVSADDVHYEIDAERALDAARRNHLDDAEGLARAVLAAAPPDLLVAQVRATEALGRALAWRGTDHSSREAEQILQEAADQYSRLGWSEPQASVIFWVATSVVLQRGDLDAAEAGMRAALSLLAPTSSRRAVILTFYAEVLITRGRWDDATAALDEAAELVLHHDDELSKAYIAWSRAKAFSLRGDAAATLRALVETERHSADWFEITTGTTFLADAAEMVGDHAGADEYLARAIAREPDDEFVRQARAMLLARRGDPSLALEALRQLPRAPWLERRAIWRHTLFAAYATLRARRPGAGELAARALAEAAAVGGLDVARFGEPAVVAALAPSAVATGSLEALEILAPGGALVVRLIGAVSLSRQGVSLEMPVGLPGALIRLLALHPAGLETDEVLDTLWPAATLDIGRRQLRDVRSRLRARVGAVVLRQGSRLRLDAGWIDVRAFGELADQALVGHDEHARARAVAALAIATGELLPTDPYAAWATEPREQFRRQRLGVLDLLASGAAERGRLDESGALLDEAIELDPYDESRYLQAAEYLTRLGRHVAARRMVETALARLDELGLPPSHELSRVFTDS